MAQDVLQAFLPAVEAWFRSTFREPTPPQVLGWPPIQRGDHALILSPTGSGKTLAAFLWGIDRLFRDTPAREPRKRALPRDREKGGVRLLYVSPLKALNNDVQRNLRVPLAGIRRIAEEQGAPLPRLEVLVRTGDTPASARQQMARRPPPILITTPESLYLLLTSPLARGMFRTVQSVIVDEIHTLVGTKRGVHLALSLERLEALAEGPIQRIGLSATQRPLDEVARFLGGYTISRPSGKVRNGGGRSAGAQRLAPRPVTVIDAGTVKPMDLRVVTAVDDFSELPGGSIWPAIIPKVLDLIESHRTTLIFANSRRQAERAADRLNEVWLARQSDHLAGAEALGEGGVAKAQGFAGTGAVAGPFRAHHGSVSREARLQLESALKEGRLPALVGTSSLELGIDIGSVDLVVQLQSPRGVARGLQRVGRSGHLVGETSVGRIFATHREDVLESAAIARAMVQGDVEPTYTPQNCLDVLAQQIVAMVSVEDWDVAALYDLSCQAYPYHKLTMELFRSVLDMLSGRYPGTSFRELRPRIAWDRIHDRLTALPGSRLLAIRNGGTIPDRGAFAAYLADRKTRLGELDEEFIFETKPGDVFTLGANTWRVQEITEDRVIVSPAPGHLPRMPFWRGDAPRRDYHLGLAYGRFRRELAQRIRGETATEVEAWLERECCLDRSSARNAIDYVRHQIEVLGAISTDRAVIAELFADPLGDMRLVIHSVFGARVNSPWALALAQAFREAVGAQPEVMVSDDGILFRFLETDREPPLELVRSMGPAEARERLLSELPSSAVFGAQFRMNAARALLLPGTSGRQKRTPFWLQRLRAKDLLAAAKGFQDFPIITETFRDCLRDVLDLEHLEEVLAGIQQGQIELVTAETVVPSPVAGGLLYDLIAQYMYEWDQPKAERQMQSLMMGRDTLAQLLGEQSLPELLRPEAIRSVEERLQHLAEGTRARTPAELATLFLALGDLTAGEAQARSQGDGPAWLEQLVASGQILPVEFALERRYVLAEHADAYRSAFAPARSQQREEERDEARRAILRRCLSTHGPLSHDWLLARYPWEPEWLEPSLAALADNGEIVAGRISPSAAPEPPPGAVREYCDRRNLERIHRATLSMLRLEVEPVPLYAYADFLARWQHVHPTERLSGSDALVRLLEQLRGLPAPGAVWERDLLPLRLAAFEPGELERMCERGDLAWVCSGGRDPRRARVRFVFRGEGSLFIPPEPSEPELSALAVALLQFLRIEGACFTSDLEQGTGLAGKELGDALVELVMAGLATNDTLPALRQVLAWGGDAGVERRPLSPLESDLATWRREQSRPGASDAEGAPGGVPSGPGAGRPMTGHAIGHRPGRRSLYAARRAVGERLERTTLPRWPGRWSLVHRIGVWGRDLPFEERTLLQARQLLHSYGIVTRESLEGDPEGGWDWGVLYQQFQLMEMRGEVRRGYFVQGLPGVQFALPEAVERLREWTRPESQADESLVLLNACDPANLFGPGLPGLAEGEGDPSRFLRIPSNYVVVSRGRPVLVWEVGSERLTSRPDLEAQALRAALSTVLEHLARSARRVTLSQWNGQPLYGSAAAPLLESLGFGREALQYVWEGGRSS